MTYKIGWFSTGRDKAARDLLRAVQKSIDEGKIRNARIAFVFSNRQRGENRESDRFFQLVEKLGLNLICFSSRKFDPDLRKKKIGSWRLLYDEEIMKRIDKFGVDLIVLAGYMLILGEKICRRYPIINLHPALPNGPKGTWQQVIWNLIEEEAEQTGAMIHLVTPELDAGPPLTYCSFPIRGGKFDILWQKMREKLKEKTLREIKEEEGEEEPLFKEIRKEEARRELPLIVHTLKLLSEGKIRIGKGRVEEGGLCVNEEVEEEIKSDETGEPGL